MLVAWVRKRCSHPVGINPGPGGEGRRRHAEASRHQVLVSVHQVIQVLFIQKALEELAVIGAGQLHAVVTLWNVFPISILALFNSVQRQNGTYLDYKVSLGVPGHSAKLCCQLLELWPAIGINHPTWRGIGWG